MRKILPFLFIISMLSGCAYNSHMDDAFSDIPNFQQVDDQVYRGGRPSAHGVRQLKERGIKTVLSLRSDDSLTFAEKHLVKQCGLEFINIPLSVYKKPTDNQVLKFLDIVIDKSKHPIYIHCESGSDQTGAMIAAYRVVVEGWTIKEAYREARELGFGYWPYHGNAELKRFIYQLGNKDIYFKRVGRQPPLP